MLSKLRDSVNKFLKSLADHLDSIKQDFKNLVRALK